MDLTLPAPDRLAARGKNPLPVADAEGLLLQIERLFEQRGWPELVLAVGMATGRSVAEILKTGEFREKTAYSVWFAGPSEPCIKCSVSRLRYPALVRAERVLAAVERLRGLFGQHFASVERADVSRAASPLVKEAAMRHFWGRIAVPPSRKQNVLSALVRGIYPQLAVYAYCPRWCDEVLYMATIQQHRKILEATSEQERVTFATAAGYLDYRLVDEEGKPERMKGKWLSKPGVEVLSVFISSERDGSDGSQETAEQRGEEEGESVEQAEEEEEEEWDIEDELEELREALSSVIVDREGNIDRRQGILLGEVGVTIKIGEPSSAAIEAVGAGRVGSLSYDAALCLLLDAYAGRSRSGLLEQVKRVAGVALCALLPEEQAVNQVRRASRASESPDLFLFAQQATVA